MAARVLPVSILQRTLDARKRQVVASGKLNTGPVDLGQRPGEFYCVTYNKTRQSSCIKYTGVAQPSASLPRVCLLCMWTPVVWSVCEGFILLSMSSGLIQLSITVHLNVAAAFRYK